MAKIDTIACNNKSCGAALTRARAKVVISRAFFRWNAAAAANTVNVEFAILFRSIAFDKVIPNLYTVSPRIDCEKRDIPQQEFRLIRHAN